MLTKQMLQDIANDLALEVAQQVSDEFTKSQWLTEEEEEDLVQTVNRVVKSKISFAFSGFAE